VGALRDDAMFAYANYAIKSCKFGRSFVFRQRVLVGQWPDWSSRLQRNSAAGRERRRPAALLGNQDHRCPICVLREKQLPREIYASGGGLLVAPLTRHICFAITSKPN